MAIKYSRGSGPEMLYSFDLSDLEAGNIVATRHPTNRAVGGHWVVYADSDASALEMARAAAHDEWTAPETRDPEAFTVTFRDAASEGR